ncbi:MAG: nitrite reductase small subunit NirD [Gammaproteobacteria bacterium]
MHAVKAGSDIESWESVCKVDDLIDNIGVCALVHGRQIAIFRLSGSKNLYAIDNHDPCSDANVLSRGIVGDLKGQVVVASPIYKQHFNLQTGQCLEDVSVKLATHPVRISDGVVQISIRRP